MPTKCNKNNALLSILAFELIGLTNLALGGTGIQALQSGLMKFQATKNMRIIGGVPSFTF